MKKIKILIADDHQIIIDGISAMLAKNPDIEVIATAKNGDEVVQFAEKFKPDIILMDISMPDVSGIEATRIIKEKNDKIRIIVLTQHENNEYIVQLLKVGADGYLLKNSKKNELIEAINAVSNNEKYIGKHASNLLLKSITKINSSEKQSQVPLTKREVEIIKMIAEDLSNQEIGQNLNISTRTVETHRRNVMQKLKVSSAVALVKYAIRNDIIKIS